MSREIGLVCAAGGNVGSVRHALRHLGLAVRDLTRPEELAACDRVILPGVGRFATVMDRLRTGGLHEAILAHVRADRPLLGICAGMQVLAETGDEGGPTAGLGLIPGHVRRLPEAGVPIPHVGWNRVDPAGSGPLFGGDPAPRDFYFVHAWAIEPDDPADVAGTCVHGRRFVAAVTRGPVMGVQFHPEKSQRDGLALLARFAGVDRRVAVAVAVATADRSPRPAGGA
jgi:glutamine amidotransferase